MRYLLASLCILLYTAAAATGQSSPTLVQPSDLATVRSAPNGLVTVASLDLPEPFLNHIILWELRAAWRDANHRVQTPQIPNSNPASAAPSQPSQGPAAAATSASPSLLPSESLGLDNAALDHWLTIPFDVPELRGFRAPLGIIADDPYPFALIKRENDPDAAAKYRAAAVFVSERLAYDSLIRTVARLMTEVEPPAPWTDSDGRLKLARMRAVGIPVDLLAMLTLEGAPATELLQKWAVNRMPRETIESMTNRAQLTFQPTCPGFQSLAEDGSQPVGLLRMQLPTNRFREQFGDGSVLDVFRQIALAAPDMPMVVTIHTDAVRDLLREMNSWNIPSPQRIVIVPQPTNVTQWAHDNAKAGVIRNPTTATAKPALLAPRYASRTELRSVCVPSDSLAVEILGRSLMDVQPSPLLFQGGNVMTVSVPSTGKRLLLIGEAEIHRNRALGLTESQILAAFAAEFGVDDCVVMPAVSFHIDLDFTIRRCGNELVACVLDEFAGARLILTDGIRALAAAGILNPAQGEGMIRAIAEGGQNAAAAVAAISSTIQKHRQQDGSYDATFAAAFAGSGQPDPAMLRADSARRFLLAMDIVMAQTISDGQLANRTPLQRRYMESLRAQSAARDRQAARLQQLGMRVHRLPGISDHEVSANPVNGLHLGDRYLMPSFGGALASLDQAAIAEFQRAFGPSVKIEPIRAAAVQSTDGGLHCMIGLHSK